MDPPSKKLRLSPLPHPHSPLPHPRADCPLYAFHHAPVNASLPHNLPHCPNCYCLLCDTLAPDCPLWRLHCMAYFTHPEWRALRYMRQGVEAAPTPHVFVPRSLLPPVLWRETGVADGFPTVIDLDRPSGQAPRLGLASASVHGADGALGEDEDLVIVNVLNSGAGAPRTRVKAELIPRGVRLEHGVPHANRDDDGAMTETPVSTGKLILGSTACDASPKSSLTDTDTTPAPRHLRTAHTAPTPASPGAIIPPDTESAHFSSTGVHSNSHSQSQVEPPLPTHLVTTPPSAPELTEDQKHYTPATTERNEKQKREPAVTVCTQPSSHCEDELFTDSSTREQKEAFQRPAATTVETPSIIASYNRNLDVDETKRTTDVQRIPCKIPVLRPQDAPNGRNILLQTEQVATPTKEHETSPVVYPASPTPAKSFSAQLLQKGPGNEHRIREANGSSTKQEAQAHLAPHYGVTAAASTSPDNGRTDQTQYEEQSDNGLSAVFSAETPAPLMQQRNETAQNGFARTSHRIARSASISFPKSTGGKKISTGQRLKVLLRRRSIDSDSSSDEFENHVTSEESFSSKGSSDGNAEDRDLLFGFGPMRSNEDDRIATSQLVKNIRSCWNVEKVIPAPHIVRKRAQPAPATSGIQFPQRVLIGHIDMWRPYCSHMNANTIELSVGHHGKDVASISSRKDIRVPGMKTSEAEVLARELGLDLSNPTVYVDRMMQDPLIRNPFDNSKFESMTSYWCEDRSEMSHSIPEALLICINANVVEVKWELSHYPGAENKDKVFAMDHDAFYNLSVSEREILLREQFYWLRQCDDRLKNVTELSTSNCCLLRAWIYLVPGSFSSNMVTAANFSELTSPQAHLTPIDGNYSLCRKLVNNYDTSREIRWRPNSSYRDKGRAPSMRLKTVLNLEKQWDNIEFSAHEGHAKENLAVLISAIRCHESGYVAPIEPANPSQRYSSVLEATTAESCSLSESLCFVHRLKQDSDILSREKALIDELRLVSNEDEGNIAKKASIGAVLSSPNFTVSEGYHKTALQPPEIRLSLRRYQRESLAWMQNQEERRSISDPFWVKIRGFDENVGVDVFYCPMTGTLSRFAPPPVVGGVLAEEMGLGKTIIAVSLITTTLTEAKRKVRMNQMERRNDLLLSHGTLIICPVTLLKQWERELQNNVSSPLNVLCWYGQSRSFDVQRLASCDVVLTTYGIMSSGSHNPLLCIDWYRMIIDESTYLKGGSSTCDNELMDLISRRRWAVSGTPFGDSFKRKFMPTMRFIGVSPFAASSHFQRLSATFSSPLCDPNLRGTFVIPHFRYVMKQIMIRHVKAQKLYGEPLVKLPPKSGECVKIHLEPSEVLEYEKLEGEVKQKAARYLRSQRLFGTHFVQLAQMARTLRIMADGVDPKTLKPESKQSGNSKSEPTLESRASSRLVGAKVKQLLRDVRSYRLIDSTSKFVVFTEFNRVKNLIKSYLEGNGFAVLTLNGSMTANRRGGIIKQFAEEHDTAVLVLSMAAGACGLTLTMANVVVLFEVGLKMAMEEQAVNRIHRIGQTRPVKTLTYVAEGTIDERIVSVRKRRGQPGVVGEDATGNGEDMSALETYRAMFRYED